MTRTEKMLYTSKTKPRGGRHGASRGSDGRLNIKRSSSGTAARGTNPEQLFGAGWSARSIGAMGMKITLPADASLDSEVDLGTTGGACIFQPRLSVSLPGLEREGRAPDVCIFQSHTGQHPNSRRGHDPQLS